MDLFGHVKLQTACFEERSNCDPVWIFLGFSGAQSNVLPQNSVDFSIDVDDLLCLEMVL